MSLDVGHGGKWVVVVPDGGGQVDSMTVNDVVVGGLPFYGHQVW